MLLRGYKIENYGPRERIQRKNKPQTNATIKPRIHKIFFFKTSPVVNKISPIMVKIIEVSPKYDSVTILTQTNLNIKTFPEQKNLNFKRLSKATKY